VVGAEDFVSGHLCKEIVTGIQLNCSPMK